MLPCLLLERNRSKDCSPNIVRVIKSRRLRWAGHVDRMEEGRSSFKILTGKPTEKRLKHGVIFVKATNVQL